MNRQQFSLIIPTLLIVLGLPWIAHSQSGGGGGGGLGVGGRGSSSSSGGSSGVGNGSGGGLGGGGMGGLGGGGMGGMGGGGMGGMGGGGMGGMGGGLMGGMGGMAFEPTIYQRPEGPPPTWLLSGLASVKATEDLRRLLNERIDIDEPHADFNVSMDYLRHKGIDVEVDSKTLEIDGIDIESVKGLSVSKGTIRELLMRVLDAQELTYRVLENHIQITSQNRAQEIPTICYYDLSFVQTNSNRLMEIINAIETSIEPDSWVNNGGVSSIVPLGQILVVSSTESAHQEIERLLARLSQTLAESSPKRQASNKTNENNVRSSQPAGENPFGSPAKSASEDPFGGNSKSANDDPFR